MAARDNVLFMGSYSTTDAAGAVIPCQLLYGVENVRTGYGTAKLMNARAFFYGGFADYFGIAVDIKNSNWIDSAGLTAATVGSATAVNRDSLSFMRGRGKEVAPNTSWMINATLPAAPTAAGVVYVLLEIEYSDVPGYNPEKQPGSPVIKSCTNNSITVAANTPISLGSFDNLLQNVEYLMAEASTFVDGGNAAWIYFIIVEGFSNQRGLIRIIPTKNAGLADPIEGTVVLTKQTYSISLISPGAISAKPVTVRFEMIASRN